MIEMKRDNRFDSALRVLPIKTAKILDALPEVVKGDTREIRLRLGGPLTLTVRDKCLFVGENSSVSERPSYNTVYTTKADLEETFKFLCHGSVYAHKDELKEGYLRMPMGNRAGVCGRIAGDTVSEIFSVNIRIARQVFGAADEIMKNFDGGGVLICGAPATGKTTVLRDLIRQLANGQSGKFYRVSVVDTRGELSAAGECGSENDLGDASDVLLSVQKAKGIEIAVRTLNPEIVAFDEVSTLEEIAEISEGFHSGVGVITTAHAGSINEIKTRNVTKALLSSGAVSTVVFLEAAGQRPQIFKVNNL